MYADIRHKTTCIRCICGRGTYCETSCGINDAANGPAPARTLPIFPTQCREGVGLISLETLADTNRKSNSSARAEGVTDGGQFGRNLPSYRCLNHCLK
ncbi:D,D-heptose 1,7-bisphosphate phosphatase [Anopheles sinensis]|uniref:D,D-heptose 1,7-bisphosphate phosphatase n=1 Tax=Anopheles sinensis TaxID=74873 RepID=A0A084WMX3_ANOSI|nr:D,D-heptose 1,7-bisphosphate phosphatase [Anopheles sinensis]